MVILSSEIIGILLFVLARCLLFIVIAGQLFLKRLSPLVFTGERIGLTPPNASCDGPTLSDGRSEKSGAGGVQQLVED